MSDDKNEEPDRTVYQPAKGKKPARKPKKDGPATEAEESPAPENDDVEANEATRFEKPATPPPVEHEATRFEKPAPKPSPEPAGHEATRFEKSPASPPVPKPSPPPAPKPAGRKQQFQEGEVLNGIYRIRRFIARGGMGEVYEASNIHQQSERVAIKVMLPHLAQDELVAAMFGKEAEMLTRLHHEAIVPYRMAARDANGLPYIVTEYIDGASLEDRLGKLTLTDEQFASLTQKLAAGLGTAHNLGAVHRDIAPDNVLLAGGDPDRPKIIDFGIAKDARENSGTIVGDGFAGKLKYVAPEQLGEFDRNIGPWTDLYSLALTLRALAAGKHSDMGGSLSDAVRKRQGIPDLSMIPERFRAAFEMALQPDPKDRPQSMAEFILRLGEPFSVTTGLRIGNTGTTEFPAGETKASKKDKAKGPSIREKLGGVLSASKAGEGAPSGLAKNKMVLIAGGVAALLLVVVISVVLFNAGGSQDEAQTADASGDAAPQVQGNADGFAPDSAEFRQVATTAMAGLECAWLTFDGVTDGTARFIGGAANPAAAQASLVDALEKGGAGAFSIDLSDVVRFEQDECAAVDALRTVRSDTSLITTPREVYEAEQQELVTSDGRVIAEGVLAKVPVRLANIARSQQLALLQLEVPGGISVVAPNRSEVEYLVEYLKGDFTDDGMAMVLGYEFEAAKREGSAIFLISSPSALPGNITAAGTQFDAAWVERFLAGARANNWTVDAVWITVEDRIRNNSSNTSAPAEEPSATPTPSPTG